MSEMSPLQLETVRNVVSDLTLRLAAAVEVCMDVSERFMTWLRETLEDGVGRGVFGQAFVLELTLEEEGTGKPATPGRLNTLANAGTRWVFVDLNGRVVNAAARNVSLTAAQCASRERHSLVVQFQSPVANFWLAGDVHDLNLESPGDTPSPRAFVRRRVQELPAVVEEHYRTCLLDEAHLPYWEDRRNRILHAEVAGRRTEHNFHQSLFWWLRATLLDHTTVYSPKGLGQSEVDIAVVTTNGTVYIEIKWMGKNSSGTTYGRAAIDVGLHQVHAYLEHDQDCYCGHLVVYDARSSKEHETNSSHDASIRHPRCHEPIVQFLQSETPSETAKRLARNKK